MKATLCDECQAVINESDVKSLPGCSEEHGPIMFKLLTENDVKVSMAFNEKKDLCKKCIKKKLAAAARDVWNTYKQYRKGE